MTGLCLTAGALTVFVALEQFTLSWIHSVERIEWQEDWRIQGRTLVLAESRVQGHGAGMEPSADATFDGTWWRSHPPLAPLEELVLARSEAMADWRLCVSSACRPLGALFPAPPGPTAVRMKPCDRPAKSG